MSITTWFARLEKEKGLVWSVRSSCHMARSSIGKICSRSSRASGASPPPSAMDRKAHLAARLESALKARKAFLQQDNELTKMRRILQAPADSMGDLKMRAKEVSANVEDRREQLCVKIRMLSEQPKLLVQHTVNCRNRFYPSEHEHEDNGIPSVFLKARRQRDRHMQYSC